MPRVLHLLKAGDHPTAQSVIERQSRQPGITVTVVLLHGASVPALPKAVAVRRLAGEGREGGLTHSELLDLIFAADSVISW